MAGSLEWCDTCFGLAGTVARSTGGGLLESYERLRDPRRCVVNGHRLLAVEGRMGRKPCLTCGRIFESLPELGLTVCYPCAAPERYVWEGSETVPISSQLARLNLKLSETRERMV